MAKIPALNLVPPPLNSPAPPRELGEHGKALWNRVTAEYDIADAGGVELLMQACLMADRAEALADCIHRDGIMIGHRAHPAIKEELAVRAFICRTLTRLGLNIEPIKPPGRPGGTHARWMPTL